MLLLTSTHQRHRLFWFTQNDTLANRSDMEHFTGKRYIQNARIVCKSERGKELWQTKKENEKKDQLSIQLVFSDQSKDQSHADACIDTSIVLLRPLTKTRIYFNGYWCCAMYLREKCRRLPSQHIPWLLQKVNFYLFRCTWTGCEQCRISARMMFSILCRFRLVYSTKTFGWWFVWVGKTATN